MIEIKDVIHLYVGCEIKISGVNGIFRIEGIEGDAAYVYNLDGTGRSIVSIELIKLILRPLCSMTEEEAKKVFTWRHGLENRDPTLQAEEFRKMLELHFDLFNLHVQGLCLYKSDLK